MDFWETLLRLPLRLLLRLLLRYFWDYFWDLLLSHERMKRTHLKLVIYQTGYLLLNKTSENFWVLIIIRFHFWNLRSGNKRQTNSDGSAAFYRLYIQWRMRTCVLHTSHNDAVSTTNTAEIFDKTWHGIFLTIESLFTGILNDQLNTYSLNNPI